MAEENDEENNKSEANTTAKETKTEGRTETTVETKVNVRKSPFGEDKYIDHIVSETGTEKWGNNKVKRDYQDTESEHWKTNGKSSYIETEQKRTENTYYVNGQPKSMTFTTRNDVKAGPSPINIAHGHTETHEYGNTKETTVKFNRNGTEKESYGHTTNYGDRHEERSDRYQKGESQNPIDAVDAVLMSTPQGKRLHVGHYHNAHPQAEYHDDNPNASHYSAKITETGEEEYTYEKNNKKYHVFRDSDGNLLATMKKDAMAAQDTLGRLASQLTLNQMRKQADKGIKKITNGKYKNTEEYLNSVNASETPTTHLNDWFEEIPEGVNLEEIKAQQKAKTEKEFQEKSKVTADSLLQARFRNISQNR